MKDYLHGVGLWAGQWEIALIVAGITQPTVGSITLWAGGLNCIRVGRRSRAQASDKRAHLPLLPSSLDCGTTGCLTPLP